MKYYIQILLSVILLLPGLAVTEELKILDPHGLTRAFKNVEKGSRVIVVLTSVIEPFSANLSQTDGIEGDISAQRKDPNRLEFYPVSSGIWQIQFMAGTAKIKEVKIEQ